jgi:hypothetical protein
MSLIFQADALQDSGSDWKIWTPYKFVIPLSNYFQNKGFIANPNQQQFVVPFSINQHDPSTNGTGTTFSIQPIIYQINRSTQSDLSCCTSNCCTQNSNNNVIIILEIDTKYK